jgi:Lrp/AsnC family leucine-responsive transcriptional regulator
MKAFLDDQTMISESAEQLDSYDRRILAILAGDGRIAITELARRIGLSKTPCQARVRKLEAAGYIQGYRAVLDPGKLGLGHVTFVEVRLGDTREARSGRSTRRSARFRRSSNVT